MGSHPSKEQTKTSIAVMWTNGERFTASSRQKEYRRHLQGYVCPLKPRKLEDFFFYERSIDNQLGKLFRGEHIPQHAQLKVIVQEGNTVEAFLSVCTPSCPTLIYVWLQRESGLEIFGGDWDEMSAFGIWTGNTFYNYLNTVFSETWGSKVVRPWD